MTAKFQLEASLHDLSGGVAPQWWTLCESGTKRQVAAFYADVDSADELARLVNGVAAESQAIASDRASVLAAPKTPVEQYIADWKEHDELQRAYGGSDIDIIRVQHKLLKRLVDLHESSLAPDWLERLNKLFTDVKYMLQQGLGAGKGG